MQVKDATRIGVYGASGSGKSTLVKSMLKSDHRQIVFDPMDEYQAFGYRRFEKLPVMGKALAKAWGKGFKFCYVPPANREASALHQLANLLKAMQADYKAGKDGRKVTLIVEELNLSFPVTSLPQELSGFSDICSRGRHYGISIIGITQRPAEVNTRFRGNLEGQYVFRLAEHNDLQAIGRVLGPNGAAEVKALAQHEYVHFDNGNREKGKNTLT